MEYRTDKHSFTSNHIWDYLLDKVRNQICSKYKLDMRLGIEDEFEEYFTNNKQFLLDTLTSEEFYTLVLFMQVQEDIGNNKLEY